MRRDAKAINVNWFNVEITSQDGNVTCRKSFITDLPGHPRERRRHGRGWPGKVGDRKPSLQHAENQGILSQTKFRNYGKENLSAVFATPNLPAFACHRPRPGRSLIERRQARTGTSQGFFDGLQTLTTNLISSSWEELREIMGFNRRPLAFGP